jgi:hypothetical protein
MANAPEAEQQDEQEHYVSGEQFQAMRGTGHGSRATKQVTVPARAVMLIIGVVVLCLASFFGGVAYQKGHGKSTTSVASTNGTAGGGAIGGAGGGGFRDGQRGAGGIGPVTAVSSTSITITNQRTNASATYAITSNTTITDNGQTVAASDIQTGDTVFVMASTSDTTTATRILVNPSFGGGAGAIGGGGGEATPESAQSN